MRLYLALIGFSLVVTIAVCDSMLRVVEESRKRRREERKSFAEIPAFGMWGDRDDFDEMGLLTWDGSSVTFARDGGESARN